MYEDFLRALLIYIEGLNAIEKRLAESVDMDRVSIPILGPIPVELEGFVVGELRDEAGGAWMYHQKEASNGTAA